MKNSNKLFIFLPLIFFYCTIQAMQKMQKQINCELAKSNVEKIGKAVAKHKDVEKYFNKLNKNLQGKNIYFFITSRQNEKPNHIKVHSHDDFRSQKISGLDAYTQKIAHKVHSMADSQGKIMNYPWGGKQRTAYVKVIKDINNNEYLIGMGCHSKL